MVATQFLKTRVSVEEKQRVQALAHHHLINESIWLKRLVMNALQESAGSITDNTEPSLSKVRSRRDGRLSIRLAPEDQLLLVERARARGMGSATYVSVLVRSHLRSLTPLPREEMMAFKRSVAELSAIGSKLNQIARAVNQGSGSTRAGREDFVCMLKVAEGLRDHFKALLRTNEQSWETGHAPTGR